MQGRRETREHPNNRSSIFDGFGDFGPGGSLFQNGFGGRDPFDDPFFTRPFGSVLRADTSRTANHSHLQQPFGRLKGPVIEELDSDDEQFSEEKQGNSDSTEASANRNPLIEHPDDQGEDPGDNDGNTRGTALSIHNKEQAAAVPGTRTASFQRVTYGGVNGAYYTATSSRTTGPDGVSFEESRETDSTSGKATHRISKGIHNKGHSVTRKLDSRGKVDTVQTLHNLNEDELVGFEQAWKGSADHRLPAWRSPFGFPSDSGNAGGFTRTLGDSSSGRQTQGGKAKKVVAINIE